MKIKKIEFIPYYFVIFFGVLIILDSVFIFLAFSSHTGLVNKNSYQEGLNYNDIISQKEKQDKLNWITYLEIENKNLIFKIQSNDNVDFSHAKVNAHFSSPINDKNDFEQTLVLKNKNSFNSQIIFPHKGVWDVRIFVHLGSNIFQDYHRLVIK